MRPTDVFVRQKSLYRTDSHIRSANYTEPGLEDLTKALTSSDKDKAPITPDQLMEHFASS